MKRLVISDAARADLEGIVRYTEQEWGAARKRRYMRAIRDRLARLRAAPGVGSPRDDVQPGYRSVAVGRHVVFYRESRDQIEIVRILHERMDMHRRLTHEPDEGPE